MAEWLMPDELDDGSELATEDVNVGTQLGRYEIVLPVAAGGMARVWAARMRGQRGFSKVVAIKTILPHLAENPEFERMFLDEARIASGVHHPNVCEIYELGEEGRVLYLAMEWVNGDSLFQVLRPDAPEAETPPAPAPAPAAALRAPAAGEATQVEGRGARKPRARVVALDPRIAARIVADACAGLHAAHELEGEDGRNLGVVHRDVSPQNVLLTLDGHVKLADFGVAKALGQAHQVTGVGQLRGKLNYMSPEQVAGVAVDRRSDVFSLGCVLYEATTGHRAFDAEAEHLILKNVMGGEFLAPSQRVWGYPRGLEAIVLRAMAPHAEGRYADALAMRVALEQWLAESGRVVVTHADVAAVVRERLGGRAERRRDRLRRGLARLGDASAGGSGAVAVGSRASRPTFGSVPDGPQNPSNSGVSQMPKPSSGGFVSPGAPPDAVPPSGRAPTGGHPSGFHAAGREGGSGAAYGPALTPPSSRPPGRTPSLFEAPEAPPRAPSFSSATLSTSSTSEPSPPRRASSWRVALGIAAALLVGLFGLARAVSGVGDPTSASGSRDPSASRTDVVRAASAAPAAPLATPGAGAPETVMPAAGAPETVTPESLPRATDVPPAAGMAGAAAATGAAIVTFALSPADAELIVDDVPMPRGETRVPVEPGRARTVYARAQGYEDEFASVDESTPREVTLTLSRARRPGPQERAGVGAGSAAGAGAGRPKPPDLPANPY